MRPTAAQPRQNLLPRHVRRVIRTRFSAFPIGRRHAIQADDAIIQSSATNAVVREVGGHCERGSGRTHLRSVSERLLVFAVARRVRRRNLARAYELCSDDRDRDRLMTPDYTGIYVLLGGITLCAGIITA